MLYFHPWEFDPGQPRLPLSRLNGWRTYVGIRKAWPRLMDLLARYPFRRAIDVVDELEPARNALPRFALVPPVEVGLVLSQTGVSFVREGGHPPTEPRTISERATAATTCGER